MKLSPKGQWIPLIASTLIAAIGCQAQAKTIAWWRFAPANSFQSEGSSHALKWWPGEEQFQIAFSDEVPPVSLYRQGIQPAQKSFDSSISNGASKFRVCSLATADKTDFREKLAEGFCAEGFFQIHGGEGNPLSKQVIWSLGDGGANALAYLALDKAYPMFVIRRSAKDAEVIQLEEKVDLPGNPGQFKGWCYFRARLVAGKMDLLVQDENGKTSKASLGQVPPLEAGVSEKARRLLIGRSSIYWDTRTEYRGGVDRFMGLIADLRFSDAGGPDGGFLLKE